MAINSKLIFEQSRRYYQALQPVMSRASTRSYTTLILSLLAISLFGWYAIRPTVRTILFLRREIADKTTLNQRMEEKITALIEAQAVYEDVQPRLSLIPQALPETPEVMDAVIQIRNFALVSGASVSAIQVSTVPILGSGARVPTPSPATHSQEPLTDNDEASSKPTTSNEGGKNQLSFPLTATVAGPYPVVKSFLEGILNMRRLVGIETLTLAPVKEESPSGTSSGMILRLVLNLNTHYSGN